MYTHGERLEIERISQIFAPYIRDARNLDDQPRCQLVWLESMQTYVLIKNYSETTTILQRDLTIMPIDNAEHLLYEVVSDIINSTYLKTILDASDTQTRAQAEAMVHSAAQIAAEHMAPYTQALPEYQEAIATMLDTFHKEYLQDIEDEEEEQIKNYKIERLH